MDIGKFKASRLRLTLWLTIPLVLLVGVGLGSYTLRLRSDWELERIQKLAAALPKLALVQQSAEALTHEFQQEGERIRTEDELMAYLRGAAREARFLVNTLKVERGTLKGLPTLTASVSGSGSLTAVQRFLGDAAAGQPLLSEQSLKISRSALQRDTFKTDISLVLILFEAKSR
jgi:hypothetical protein